MSINGRRLLSEDEDENRPIQKANPRRDELRSPAENGKTLRAREFLPVTKENRPSRRKVSRELGPWELPKRSKGKSKRETERKFGKTPASVETPKELGEKVGPH